MVEKKSFQTILFSIWKHSSENSNIGDITDRSSRDIELLKTRRIIILYIFEFRRFCVYLVYEDIIVLQCAMYNWFTFIASDICFAKPFSYESFFYFDLFQYLNFKGSFDIAKF